MPGLSSPSSQEHQAGYYLARLFHNIRCETTKIGEKKFKLNRDDFIIEDTDKETLPQYQALQQLVGEKGLLVSRDDGTTGSDKTNLMLSEDITRLKTFFKQLDPTSSKSVEEQTLQEPFRFIDHFLGKYTKEPIDRETLDPVRGFNTYKKEHGNTSSVLTPKHQLLLALLENTHEELFNDYRNPTDTNDFNTLLAKKNIKELMNQIVPDFSKAAEDESPKATLKQHYHKLLKAITQLKITPDSTSLNNPTTDANLLLNTLKQIGRNAGNFVKDPANNTNALNNIELIRKMIDPPSDIDQLIQDHEQQLINNKDADLIDLLQQVVKWQKVTSHSDKSLAEQLQEIKILHEFNHCHDIETTLNNHLESKDSQKERLDYLSFLEANIPKIGNQEALAKAIQDRRQLENQRKPMPDPQPARSQKIGVPHLDWSYFKKILQDELNNSSASLKQFTINSTITKEDGTTQNSSKTFTREDSFNPDDFPDDHPIQSIQLQYTNPQSDKDENITYYPPNSEINPNKTKKQPTFELAGDSSFQVDQALNYIKKGYEAENAKAQDQDIDLGQLKPGLLKFKLSEVSEDLVKESEDSKISLQEYAYIKATQLGLNPINTPTMRKEVEQAAQNVKPSNTETATLS